MSLNLMIVYALGCAALYYVCPLRFRWLILLAASYGFYAYHGLTALPFILITTLTTWAGALHIARIGENGKAEIKAKKAELTAEARKQMKAAVRSRQRRWFFGVLLLNFFILGVLKYLEPTLGLFASIASVFTGGEAARPALGLLLPLGISFYTFSSMGYLIDVYNEKYAPEKSPLRFALYVSFFPQLIQGPIGRYDHLGGELAKEHRFDIDGIERGLLLMLWGYFKKKVIADRALPLVAAVFDHQEPYGGAVIMLAVLFYSLQQYCDFSGGIDLVAGIAELFGVRLAPNFKRPYFAVSLGDFWRRWHISLGSWMRDYVFYPFALTKPVSRLSKASKNRFGTDFSRALPAALGNVLVFFLVGIWHGAQMNYVLWGLYNGLILAFSALMETRYKRFADAHEGLVKSRGFYFFRILRTFVIVNIGWYFDRAMRWQDAFAMLGKTFTGFNAAQLADSALMAQLGLTARDYGVLAIATAILFFVSLAQERGAKVREWIMSRPLVLRWILLYAFILFVLATFVGNSAGTGSFMYAVF
ncbi:MAG: MBOAT family protein [Clostridia bacterium]|nr:MBOAT family protein [Clostridia bacterium]